MTDTTRTTRYPIDERAHRILAAAFSEFSRRGVRSARLSLIARRAGVSPATLRQYFPTTDELFREVVRTMIVRVVRHAEPPAPPVADAPLADQLRQFIRAFWRRMEEPDQAALLRLSIGELGGFPELALFHATQVIGATVARVEAMLLEGRRRGEIRPRDLRALARVIVASLVMYGVWLASPEVYGDLTGFDRQAAEEAALEALLEVVAHEVPAGGPWAAAVPRGPVLLAVDPPAAGGPGRPGAA